MYRAFVQFIIQTNKCTTHTHTHTNTQTHTHTHIYIYKQYFVYRKFSYMFRCICIIFRKSCPSICRRRKFPEDDADASKHVGVLTIYKILLTYIYIFIYICCSFVGLGNIQRDLHSFIILRSVWWQFLTDVLVHSLGPIFQGQEIQEDFLTLEVETNKLSRNVGKEFPPYAA